MGPRRAALIATAALAAIGCRHSSELDLGPSPPGVLVSPTVAYYDVTANTLFDLRRAMVIRGPQADGRRWAAATGSRLTWRYQMRTGNTGCELYDVKLRVLTTITFPRWNPVGVPDSALVEWWDEFRAGLADHERGHAQLSIKAASNIRSALEGLSGGNCDALRIRAADIGNRIMRSLETEQAEYDTTTRHGGTQIERVRRLREP